MQRPCGCRRRLLPTVPGYAIAFTLLIAQALAVAPAVAGLAQAQARAQPPAPERLTVDRLKALKQTSNDPEGDAFVDSREKLDALVDAFVADNALASPMYLYFAANTAWRLGRLEDAAFLFYAAQLRKAVDLKRYNIDAVANGNNAATYFAFLNQTIGMNINPAIMREPKLFAAAIQRIDAWTLLPAPRAYYPEFEEAKGFRLNRDEWPRLAATTKEAFMMQFGRKYATLLNDPGFFEAFQFVQAYNQGKIDGSTTANRKRFEKSLETMHAIEGRLTPSPPQASAPPPRDAEPATASPAASAEVASHDPSTDPPLRVGDGVPAPKSVRYVEPKFPAGAHGTVVLEITVTRQGKVDGVRILRGQPNLDKAAETAVRQWVFQPVLVDGRPVAVLHTVTLTAR